MIHECVGVRQVSLMIDMIKCVGCVGSWRSLEKSVLHRSRVGYGVASRQRSRISIYTPSI